MLHSKSLLTDGRLGDSDVNAVLLRTAGKDWEWPGRIFFLLLLSGFLAKRNNVERWVWVWVGGTNWLGSRGARSLLATVSVIVGFCQPKWRWVCASLCFPVFWIHMKNPWKVIFSSGKKKMMIMMMKVKINKHRAHFLHFAITTHKSRPDLAFQLKTVSCLRYKEKSDRREGPGGYYHTTAVSRIDWLLAVNWALLSIKGHTSQLERSHQSGRDPTSSQIHNADRKALAYYLGGGRKKHTPPTLSNCVKWRRFCYKS